jgi:hypothetical protein
VINVACTTKRLRTSTLLETSEVVECEKRIGTVEVDVYDEVARRYRQYLAQQEALRQLELIKTQALASAHRISFFR